MTVVQQQETLGERPTSHSLKPAPCSSWTRRAAIACALSFSVLAAGAVGAEDFAEIQWTPAEHAQRHAACIVWQDNLRECTEVEGKRLEMPETLRPGLRFHVEVVGLVPGHWGPWSEPSDERTALSVRSVGIRDWLALLGDFSVERFVALSNRWGDPVWEVGPP